MARQLNNIHTGTHTRTHALMYARAHAHRRAYTYPHLQTVTYFTHKQTSHMETVKQTDR